MTKLAVSLFLALLGGVFSARLDHLVPQNYVQAQPRNLGGNEQPFHFENINNGDGAYKFSYDTPEGISAQESGAPRAAGPEGLAVTAEGGFSYRAPDGQQVSLTYTADENGFHPVGSHIPTPPPIPEAILRSIEFNSRNPSPDSGPFNAPVAVGRNARY